jgi:RNA polymerase sigma-70 factor, ECF subfamily
MLTGPASDQFPDDELLRRITAGDPRAFTLLFRRRQGEVYRFALHMTASRTIAEDVTQDVFVTVMREAGRYDAGRATVAAWLCGIARNFVRRRLEHERAWQPLGDEGTDIAADAQSDPLEDLARGQQIEALRRAVLTLPVRYREVVVLCDLQEMTYVEAAQALDCAVGTVRSRLHRARALLAAKVAVTYRRQPEDATLKRRGRSCFA